MPKLVTLRDLNLSIEFKDDPPDEAIHQYLSQNAESLQTQARELNPQPWTEAIGGNIAGGGEMMIGGLAGSAAANVRGARLDYFGEVLSHSGPVKAWDNIAGPANALLGTNIPTVQGWHDKRVNEQAESEAQPGYEPGFIQRNIEQPLLDTAQGAMAVRQERQEEWNRKYPETRGGFVTDEQGNLALQWQNITNPKRIAGLVSEQVPVMLSMILAAKLGGAAAGAKAGAVGTRIAQSVAGGAMEGAMSQGNVYLDLQDADMPESEKQSRARLSGLISGVAGAASLDTIFRDPTGKGFRAMFMKAGQSWLSEFVTEGFQEGSEAALTGKSWSEIVNNASEGAVAGGIVGGATDVALHLPSATKNTTLLSANRKPKPVKPPSRAGFISNLNTLVAEMESLQAKDTPTEAEMQRLPNMRAQVAVMMAAIGVDVGGTIASEERIDAAFRKAQDPEALLTADEMEAVKQGQAWLGYVATIAKPLNSKTSAPDSKPLTPEEMTAAIQSATADSLYLEKEVAEIGAKETLSDQDAARLGQITEQLQANIARVVEYTEKLNQPDSEQRAVEPDTQLELSPVERVTQLWQELGRRPTKKEVKALNVPGARSNTEVRAVLTEAEGTVTAQQPTATPAAPSEAQTIQEGNQPALPEIGSQESAQKAVSETSKQEILDNQLSHDDGHAKAVEVHKTAVRLRYKASIQSVLGQGATIADVDDGTLSVKTRGGHEFTVRLFPAVAPSDIGSASMRAFAKSVASELGAKSADVETVAGQLIERAKVQWEGSTLSMFSPSGSFDLESKNGQKLPHKALVNIASFADVGHEFKHAALDMLATDAEKRILAREFSDGKGGIEQESLIKAWTAAQEWEATATPGMKVIRNVIKRVRQLLMGMDAEGVMAALSDPKRWEAPVTETAPQAVAQGVKPTTAKEARAQRVAKKQAAEAPAPVRAPVTRVDGSKTEVLTSGDPVQAQYALMELSDLTASHDFRSGVPVDNVQAGRYPAGLQPRDYSSGTAEHEKIVRFAGEKKAPLSVNTAPSADGGPPTVSPDGTVINGNGRVMSLQYGLQGEGNLDWYRNHLRENAGTFGLTADQVDGMQNPVLVRVADMDPSSAEAVTLARQGNVSTTQAQNSVQTAAAMKRRVGLARVKNALDRASSVIRGEEDGQVPSYSVERTDREYLDAVARGDMEAAQRMVDQAAMRAGYTVGPVLHGTADSRPLDARPVFDHMETVTHVKNSRVAARLQDALDREATKPGHPTDRYMALLQKVRNNKVDTQELKPVFFTNSLAVARTYADDRRSFDYQNAEPSVRRFYIRMRNPLRSNAQGRSWGQKGGYAAQVEQIATARAQGHDGLIIENTRDAYENNEKVKPHAVYVTFDAPNQIKSADPVTRDDQGNVIPLSQRFNEDSEDIRYQVVYHGGPNEWQPEPGFPHGRPRLDKIGTGEGAQAYGWGWYSAENEDVADSYKDMRSLDRMFSSTEAVELWEKFSKEHEEVSENLYQDVESQFVTGIRDADLGRMLAGIANGHTYYDVSDSTYAQIRDVVNGGFPFPKEPKGTLYKLDIPDDVIPTLLDWDRPLNEQSEGVRKALEKVEQSLDPEMLDGYLDRINAEWGELTGAELYKKILNRAHMDDVLPEKYSDSPPYRVISEFLRDFGIPGLKYLDGASRRGRGDGTYNYVIWDQAVLDRVALLDKNQQAIEQAQETPRYSARRSDKPDATATAGKQLDDGVRRVTPGIRNLSNPHIEEDLRRAWNTVQAVYDKFGLPTPETIAEKTQEAQDMIKAHGVAPVLDRMIRAAKNGESLTNVADALAARMAIDMAVPTLLEQGDGLRAAELYAAYSDTRTEAARILGMVRDQFVGDMGRNHLVSELRRAVMSPGDKLKGSIKDASDAAHAPGVHLSPVEQSRIERMKRINAKRHARELARTYAYLKRQGVDMASLDQYSDRKLIRYIKDVYAGKHSWMDALYEFRLSWGLLSAPKSLIIDPVSTGAHIVWTKLPKHFVEALINVGVGDPLGAQFRDFADFGTGFVPGVARGVRNLITTLIDDDPALYRELGRSPKRFDEAVSPASRGLGGRASRAVLTLKESVDMFMMSVSGTMEVTALARKVAIAEGLSGPARQKRIADLVSNGQSVAWTLALARAEKDAFREDLPQWMYNTGLANANRVAGLRYLQPFVKTPFNLVKLGLRYTPLGTASLPFTWGNLTVNQRTERVAEQVLAYSLTVGLMGLLGMLGGGDDPDEPSTWITGTAPIMPRGERETFRRGYQPLSVWDPINKDWVSYARMDPFATTLGLIVDELLNIRDNGMDPAHIGKAAKNFAGLFGDKLYLKTLGDISDLIDAAKSEQIPDFMQYWGQGFAASFAPNVYRSMMLNADPYVREGGDPTLSNFMDMLAWRFMPTEGNAPPAKVDLWGRKIQRGATPVYRALVPFDRFDPATRSPLERNLDGMLEKWNATAEKPWYPTGPSWTFTVDGVTQHWTPQEYAQLREMAGKRALEKLGNRNLNFTQPTQKDIDRMKEELEDAASWSRDRLKRQRRLARFSPH